MGLNARVYCDCYERGLLRQSPPQPELIFVDSDGSLFCSNDQIELRLEFDDWLTKNTCAHEDRVSTHHYLGNIVHVQFLRERLSAYKNDFPLILTKVIYNGVHCGDFISLEKIQALREEILGLSVVHSGNAQEEEILRDFERQMNDLIDAAIQHKKPIAF